MQTPDTISIPMELTVSEIAVKATTDTSFSDSLNILSNGSYRLDHLKTKLQKLYFHNSKKIFHRFLDDLSKLV